MARISGVDLPRNKRMEVALTYIYGIGQVTAKEICKLAKFDKSLRTDDLSDDQLVSLREIIEKNYQVEGERRKEVNLAIKRLMDLGCYRGLRHRKGLPVRGQNTQVNARTRKGPKRTVANKKKT